MSILLIKWLLKKPYQKSPESLRKVGQELQGGSFFLSNALSLVATTKAGLGIVARERPTLQSALEHGNFAIPAPRPPDKKS